MKYTLKIQLKNGGEISSEPFELGWEPEQVNIEAVGRELPTDYYELGDISGFYINSVSEIEHIRNADARLVSSKNILKTIKQAESALAYAQLTQLMKAYNGDWEPDWNDHKQPKQVIRRVADLLAKETFLQLYHPIAFKTIALRDEFLKNFEPLIKTFYQI